MKSPDTRAYYGKKNKSRRRTLPSLNSFIHENDDGPAKELRSIKGALVSQPAHKTDVSRTPSSRIDPADVSAESISPSRPQWNPVIPLDLHLRSSSSNNHLDSSKRSDDIIKPTAGVLRRYQGSYPEGSKRRKIHNHPEQTVDIAGQVDEAAISYDQLYRTLPKSGRLHGSEALGSILQSTTTPEWLKNILQKSRIPPEVWRSTHRSPWDSDQEQELGDTNPSISLPRPTPLFNVGGSRYEQSLPAWIPPVRRPSPCIVELPRPVDESHLQNQPFSTPNPAFSPRQRSIAHQIASIVPFASNPWTSEPFPSHTTIPIRQTPHPTTPSTPFVSLEEQIFGRPDDTSSTASASDLGMSLRATRLPEHGLGSRAGGIAESLAELGDHSQDFSFGYDLTKGRHWMGSPFAKPLKIPLHASSQRPATPSENDVGKIFRFGTPPLRQPTATSPSKRFEPGLRNPSAEPPREPPALFSRIGTHMPSEGIYPSPPLPFSEIGNHGHVPDLLYSAARGSAAERKGLTSLWNTPGMRALIPELSGVDGPIKRPVPIYPINSTSEMALYEHQLLLPSASAPTSHSTARGPLPRSRDDDSESSMRHPTGDEPSSSGVKGTTYHVDHLSAANCDFAQAATFDHVRLSEWSPDRVFTRHPSPVAPPSPYHDRARHEGSPRQAPDATGVGLNLLRGPMSDQAIPFRLDSDRERNANHDFILKLVRGEVKSDEREDHASADVGNGSDDDQNEMPRKGLSFSWETQAGDNNTSGLGGVRGGDKEGVDVETEEDPKFWEAVEKSLEHGTGDGTGGGVVGDGIGRATGGWEDDGEEIWDA